MEQTRGIEIGNWLFDKNGIPKRVETIDEDSVSMGGELNHFSTIKPIPLTEEILEKNGIRYQFGYPWWQSNGIKPDYGGYEVHFNPACQFVVRYVHELQNSLNIIHPMEIYL